MEASSFVELKLSRAVIKGLNEIGFLKPTPIQAQAIPHILKGEDVCATAITGSGKSAAFLIPIIDKLMMYRGRPGPKALIMSPTRELAQQLHAVAQQIGKYAYVSSALVIGGCSNEEQAEMLNPIPDIIFATPGRIVEQLFKMKTITADHIIYYVLDEADRLLGRGFEAELTAINSSLTHKHQTLLFTATMSDQVRSLTKTVLGEDAVKVAIDMYLELSPKLKQMFVKVKSEDRRMPLLVALVKNKCRKKTIVFFPTKMLAHQAALMFNFMDSKGVKSAAELHADLPQAERQESVERFKNGEVRVLLASDLAARGLDIPDIEYVINYTIPTEIERYIHRVGRTARAGKEGTAISLVLEPHEKQIQRKMTKHSAKGTVEKLQIPADLFEKAKSQVSEYQAKVDEEIAKEEEEKIKRAQENEVKRMKAILDVEDEIPQMTKEERMKSKTKKPRNHADE